jgi:hypothetical protein
VNSQLGLMRYGWGFVKSWFKWSLVHANYTCVWLMWHSQFIVADWISNYMMWC